MRTEVFGANKHVTGGFVWFCVRQDFWFTAEQSCVPGGPSFDYTYYNTYTAVVGAFTGWIGIIIFQVRGMQMRDAGLGRAWC